MALKLYNYLTRQTELFRPVKQKRVGFYSCGPTVYDRVHIGNLRTYIFEDVLKKTLESQDYKVTHITNITDIEDKIIKKMLDENKNLKAITAPYLKLFLDDIKKLNIKRSTKYPKATEHIKEIISLINILIKKGVAYKGDDGSVYFDTKKFKNYGQLSGLQKCDLQHGARIETDEYNKKSAGDFVLWKAAKQNEPFWNSPFGKGRPGWHIECSAMSIKYLGKTFDIHAGAVDLIFPHHENEIAQSEMATGQKFAKYFIEGEHLLVEGQKMSKSLGNFFTLNDLIEKDIDPLAFRYLVLTSHYRSQLNFTWDSLKAAQESLKNIYSFASKKFLKTIPRSPKKESSYRNDFVSAINDDLNTPVALNVLWNLIRDNNTPHASKEKLIAEFDKILGLNLKTSVKIPTNIIKIVKEREKARAEKDWKRSDLLRQNAERLGWIIEDTPNGSAIRKNI